MVADRFTLTQAGYEALQRELQNLEAEHGQDQKNFDDVNYSSDPSHEEAAYDDTKQTKEINEDRIEHLKTVLANAEVIGEDPDPTRVDPGDRVTVWDFTERQTLQFDLIGGSEVIYGQEGVSIDSPVGKALLGHRVGDVIEVEVPDGKERYAIRQIEPIPAST